GRKVVGLALHLLGIFRAVMHFLLAALKGRLLMAVQNQMTNFVGNGKTLPLRASRTVVHDAPSLRIPGSRASMPSKPFASNGTGLVISRTSLARGVPG